MQRSKSNGEEKPEGKPADPDAAGK